MTLYDRSARLSVFALFNRSQKNLYYYRNWKELDRQRKLVCDHEAVRGREPKEKARQEHVDDFCFLFSVLRVWHYECLSSISI